MADVRPTFYGEGMCVPGTNNVTYVPYRKPMPCVVIFVHGVNSEGEWYLDAENGLVAGLNERLGRRDLRANTYTRDKRTLETSNKSPVIRFYWGYCAPVKETDNHTFEYKIPLKTRRKIENGTAAGYKYHAYSHHYPEGKPDAPERPIEPNIKGATYYWGGGPFQNGTTSLNMSWYDGFDLNGVIDVGSRFVNPEIDRPLYKSPPRTYYAHASRRLADLIDSIYEKYPDDTVAVVSHSQGTMIALLAMLYVKRVPDTLFVCNSPYRMSNSLTDSITMGGQAPTSRSHVKTFFNILDRFQAGKREPTEQDLNGVGGLVDPVPPAADDARIADGEGEKQDGRPLWIPESPRTMHIIREHVSIGKNDKIHVNAPRVPNPMPSGNDAAQREADQSPAPLQSTIRPMSMWEFNEAIDPDVKLTDADDFFYYRELIYDRQRDMVEDRSDPYRSGPAFRQKTDDEIHAALSQTPAVPTNHSTILKYKQGELVKRVMAYDMPIGQAKSFHNKEFWNELRRKADWLESDPYYLNAASRSSHECTSADGVPPPPPEVDKETQAMATARANEERAREAASGVYHGS
jgi:pimeloyl-ACP methyl ester carboxylesterase